MQPNWPYFKWAGGSHDHYFAELDPNCFGINVYHISVVGSLEKKLVQLERVQNFSWSPCETILAVYQVQLDEIPTRLVLLRFPAGEEIRQKHFFKISAIELFWHPN